MTYRARADRRAELTMTRFTRLRLRLEKPGPKPTPESLRNTLMQLYPPKRLAGLYYGPPNRALWAAMAFAAGWMTEAQFEAVPLEQPEYLPHPFFLFLPDVVESQARAAWDWFDKRVRPYLDRATKRTKRRRRRRP